MGEIKLHLGCGKRDWPGWVNIDGGDYPHLHYKDITKIPFADNSVDLIYSSHTLEYFDRVEVLDVLREWYRVLCPGGTIRIAVPDFYEMARLYIQENFKLDNFIGPLYGRMKMGENFIYHKTTYDFRTISEILNSVGFKDVSRYDWRNVEPFNIDNTADDCSRAYLPHMNFENGTLISLNVEAVK